MKKIIALFGLGLGLFAPESSVGQTWTPVQNVPSGLGANNPLLLTDGSVLIQSISTNNWYKLTPDNKGNYATGTWTQLASDASDWQPYAFGSEVMPDGRVFAIGGEYNLGLPAWTNLGGVYDPVKNVWSTIQAPAPWTGMGDTATVVLPNGLVYVADPLSSQTAAFNPATNQFIYPYGGDALMYSDEAGMILLPNGNVFRTDCWQASTAEVFNTQTLQWSFLPQMPYNVCDLSTAEMGPAIVQYNGQVFQFGSNGSNIIYDPNSNTWIPAPSFPTNSYGQIDVADGAAVLLPNGNIMVDAGPGYYAGPSQWFIWNGSTLSQIPGPPDAANTVSPYGEFLLLPSGQVLLVDLSSDVELYNPGGAPNSAWAPRITSVPSQLKQTEGYTIYGTQFNGLSGGAAFGDDQQSFTNYPMIRITNNATGHVFYAREYNPSTMAICTGNTTVWTHFQVPKNAELGPSKIQVVTNGIASQPVNVTVYPPLEPYAVSIFPGQGASPRGNLADIDTVDGLYFYGTSVSNSLGQVCAVEADFNVGTSSISSVQAFASALGPVGGTEQLFIYNYKTSQFVLVNQATFGKTEVSVTGSPTTNTPQFVSPGGEVRVVVRGLVPAHVSAQTFTMGVDYVGLSFG